MSGWSHGLNNFSTFCFLKIVLANGSLSIHYREILQIISVESRVLDPYLEFLHVSSLKSFWRSLYVHSMLVTRIEKCCRWFLGYSCCDACGRLFVKGNYCPVCLKVLLLLDSLKCQSFLSCSQPNNVQGHASFLFSFFLCVLFRSIWGQILPNVIKMHTSFKAYLPVPVLKYLFRFSLCRNGKLGTL